ncbi:hypothetical protein [Acinetobacter sp. ANC 3882]|uniref:hypothetical protein n=1 Tax=Acinetobacter sp. ANC 3882 TaxID=2923423 RepID=UPI001F4AF05C|nr:hypothetical protein [Acinetobacter sp. ANC 3882]MCH7312886.1 hypothetical protein [Acinetobacter sp. ANC 3882]
MNKPISPNMYIKPDYSAQVEQWLAEGNQIKALVHGEGALSKNFNNRDKSKSPQDAMRQVMSNSVAIAKAQKANPFVKARAEARSKGLIHYTGCKCKSCGSTKKFVSTNSCVECNRSKAAIRMSNKNMTKRDGEGR